MTEQKFSLPDDLYNYQLTDGDRIVNSNQNWLLCHEMGVGKTPITIYAVEKAGYQLPLVICPNSLRYEWARQVKEWTGLDAAVSGTYYAKGGKMGQIIRSLTSEQNRKYRIVNYESLRVSHALDLLKIVPWDVVIFDEIHKLRNPYMSKLKQVVKGAWDFLNAIPPCKVLGLSGSPILNYPDDLYGPLSACFPERYPRNATSLRLFLHRYMLYSSGRYGSYAYGTRNLDLLRGETRDLIIKRTKAEVLPFLPDKYYQRPELEMPDDQRKLYDQMERELRILLDTGEPLWSPTVLALLTRLRQINLDPKIVGVTTSSAKTEFLLDLVDSTDEKLVIFSCFEKYIYLLSELLKAEKKECAIVTGQVPVEQRAREVARFQGDESCRIFLGTIQCAGEGITLTASSTVVLADRWWNEPTNQQAVDRLHRIGQKNAVQVILPVCTKSVDSLLDEILQRKHEASQAYFGENEVRASVFSILQAL